MGRFDNLPKEIILEILTRLPTESVLECKSVCKPWRDIVRLPSFSQMHLARLTSADGDSGKLSFIFLSREKELQVFYYAEYDENCQQTPFIRETRMDLSPKFNRHCSFVGSCNGLICFISWIVDENYKLHDGLTCVCNPITREYIILKESTDLKRKLSSWTGFGYSSSTNEYKFVRIDASREDSNVGIVQVYTLGSGWKTVGKTENKNMKHVEKRTGAFANGALHWVDQAGTIIAFSLTDEKFSEILPPPPCLTRAVVPYLFVLKALGDFVGATCYYIDGCINTWLLEKNKDNNDLSWTEEFTLEFNSLLPILFGFTKSGMLLCYENKKIYGYNSRASSAKMDVMSFGKSISQAIPHKNTFISLKLLGEKDTKTMESSERASSS